MVCDMTRTTSVKLRQMMRMLVTIRSIRSCMSRLKVGWKSVRITQ